MRIHVIGRQTRNFALYEFTKSRLGAFRPAGAERPFPKIIPGAPVDPIPAAARDAFHHLAILDSPADDSIQIAGYQPAPGISDKRETKHSPIENSSILEQVSVSFAGQPGIDFPVLRIRMNRKIRRCQQKPDLQTRAGNLRYRRVHEIAGLIDKKSILRKRSRERIFARLHTWTLIASRPGRAHNILHVSRTRRVF